MNIYGASGHAKVIIDIILSQGEKIYQIFDEDPSIVNILGYEINHNPSEVLRNDIPTIVGIGNNRSRQKVAISIRGKIPPCLSHTSAVISSSARIDHGTVVMANATINAEATIGKHCIINTGAVVEHESEIKDFVHISPNATIAGNVKIGEGTHIGIGAFVIPGVTIGKWTVIGAGAVIIDDIPDYAVVVGNPGKIIKYNKVEDE